MPPPPSQPPEVLPEAQRLARDSWVRSFTAFREPLAGEPDPVAVAARSTPDDHGLEADGG